MYANAFLWSIGNGLASSMLVIYLALEYGAEGLAISLILAAPKIVGVTRLATPAFIAASNRKSVCLSALFVSNTMLLALPFVSAPHFLPVRFGLPVLIVLWAGYHLLEYIGVVALWSWLGDVAPQEQRGRFLGGREVWLTVGRIIGALLSALFSYGWLHWPTTAKFIENSLGENTAYLGYAIPAVIGATMMLCSLWPLILAPALENDTTHAREVKKPQALEDSLETSASNWKAYLPLLLFGSWFAIANGFTQAAQGMYPRRVVGASLAFMLVLATVMRLGQAVFAPLAGFCADTFGNRRQLMICQFVVALGPGCFLLASAESWWWLVFAYLCWVAYIGLNVSLPTVMLNLAPTKNRTLYIAVYYALFGVIYGVSTICGGILLDVLAERNFQVEWLGRSWSHYHLFFAIGTVLRATSIIWLWMLVEPAFRSDSL